MGDICIQVVLQGNRCESTVARLTNELEFLLAVCVCCHRVVFGQGHQRVVLVGMC